MGQWKKTLKRDGTTTKHHSDFQHMSMRLLYQPTFGHLKTKVKSIVLDGKSPKNLPLTDVEEDRVPFVQKKNFLSYKVIKT